MRTRAHTNAEADDAADGSFVEGATSSHFNEADDHLHWELAPSTLPPPEASGVISAAESFSVQGSAQGWSNQPLRYGRASGSYKRRVLEWVQSSSQEGLNIAEDRSTEQTVTDASTGEVRNMHAVTESHSDVCSETCESNKIQERQVEFAVVLAVENPGADSELVSEQHEDELNQNDQNSSDNCDDLWNGDNSGAPMTHRREREFSSTEALSQDLQKEEVECEEQPEVLSKNAHKRLQKMERYQFKKRERKAMEKVRRHQETQRRRQEWQGKMAALPADLQERAMDERRLAREARKEQSSQKKERLRQAMQFGQNLVLDLDFCDFMKPGEVISLSQQVMYSYAANAKAKEPVRLSLTGCKGDIRLQLEKVSGFDNWLLHKEGASYIEVFKDRQADLVYLTADSEHLLDKLVESKIYIVGGLVDRNRWKGMTYRKAKEHGIATARLPIAENLNMAASKVLTVNQVVEILLGFMETKDWTKVLTAAVPQRKLPVDEDVSGSNA